jgi:hypothetical protein
MGWTLVWGVIALVAAAVGARLVGRWLKIHPAKWYYGALVAIALVAIALLFVSIAVKAGDPASGDAFWGLGLGVGCGGLAGLRYGYKGLFEIPGAKAGS